MKRKLTLTLEEQVINSAKNYAQTKGESLSGIVENYLKSITDNEKMELTISAKVDKMMGAIKLSEDFDYKKKLGDAITKRCR